MKVDKVFKFIFARDYFRDRTILLLLVSLTLFLLVNLALVIFGSDPGDAFIKTKFNGYGVGSFSRGAGYGYYVFSLFALISYLSVVALSIKTYNLRKSLSILQLNLGLVVLFLLFFVTRSLIVA